MLSMSVHIYRLYLHSTMFLTMCLLLNVTRRWQQYMLVSTALSTFAEETYMAHLFSKITVSVYARGHRD
jgi:hypothetical protein